jgi:hypothetical protein
MTKLLRIIRSPNPEKKWRAVFQTDTGREKNVDFGAAGMEDYTQHGDPERRERYRERHNRNLQTGDPTRAGFLSYYILWGPHKSVGANMKYYKSKFKL